MPHPLPACTVEGNPSPFHGQVWGLALATHPMSRQCWRLQWAHPHGAPSLGQYARLEVYVAHTTMAWHGMASCLRPRLVVYLAHTTKAWNLVKAKVGESTPPRLGLLKHKHIGMTKLVVMLAITHMSQWRHAIIMLNWIKYPQWNVLLMPHHPL